MSNNSEYRLSGDVERLVTGEFVLSGDETVELNEATASKYGGLEPVSSENDGTEEGSQ